MESFSEGFCDLKKYELVTKKLKGPSKLADDTVAKFIQFVKENRNKRKSSALSFEVSLKVFDI